MHSAHLLNAFRPDLDLVLESLIRNYAEITVEVIITTTSSFDNVIIKRQCYDRDTIICFNHYFGAYGRNSNASD